MRRRSANNERPLAPTAPRRRPGSSPEAGQADTPPVELNPTSSLSKVVRQRELANATRVGNSRPSRPSKLSMAAGLNAVRPTRRVRPVATQVVLSRSTNGPTTGLHPLSNGQSNAALRAYEESTLGSFDRIVPVLKRLSALQHDSDFVAQAQRLALAELGHELPAPILEQAWTSQLDMRTLIAWSVYEAYEQSSIAYYTEDPLAAQEGSRDALRREESLVGRGDHLRRLTRAGRFVHTDPVTAASRHRVFCR